MSGNEEFLLAYSTCPVSSPVHMSYLQPPGPEVRVKPSYLWRLISRQKVFTSISEWIYECIIFQPLWCLPELCIYCIYHYITWFFCCNSSLWEDRKMKLLLLLKNKTKQNNPKMSLGSSWNGGFFFSFKRLGELRHMKPNVQGESIL